MWKPVAQFDFGSSMGAPFICIIIVSDEMLETLINMKR